VNIKLRKFILELQFNSPFRRYSFPRFLYNFSAPQLCFLCQCLEETRSIDGSIAEIGCGNGSTTVFLNKYMDARNIQKNYYAVDTFSGFVPDDIEYEIAHRAKSKADLLSAFTMNKKRWFDRTMRQNDIGRVHSIEADVNRYDLTTLGPLSFALLDVDLYRPTTKGLKELYKILLPGGMIAVDDCDPANALWDGADQAYKEFMIVINQSPQVVHGKLGILRKTT